MYLARAQFHANGGLWRNGAGDKIFTDPVDGKQSSICSEIGERDEPAIVIDVHTQGLSRLELIQRSRTTIAAKKSKRHGIDHRKARQDRSDGISSLDAFFAPVALRRRWGRQSRQRQVAR